MHPVKLTDFIAIVTDFDDTVLNSNSLHEHSRLHAFHTVGVHNNIPALATLPADVSAMAFPNALTHSEEGASWWVFQQIGLVAKDATCDPANPLIQEMIMAKSELYRKLLVTDATEVPGAHRFFELTYNNGFANMQAIASTANRDIILSFSDNHNLSEFFTPAHIVAKEDTANAKPHPEAFQKAVESLGLTVADAPKVLAFEDDPRGIQAAKELGMYTCAVTTRFSATELMSLAVHPDMVAANFNEYISIFGLAD